MNEKSKLKILLFVLIIIFFAVNYPVLDKVLTNWFVDYEVGFVERVIDGDTIVINGSSVRLLGINCAEKGEPYYNEAKLFLEKKVLNKIVKMKFEKEDVDLYRRKLRYVFVDGENINEKLVEEGLANIYFPSGKDSYYNSFSDAWKTCIENKKNLCEKSDSVCSSCIELKKLDTKNQKLVLKNNCGFGCDLTSWSIKDEGRKKFVFENFVLEKEVVIIVGDGKNTKENLFWSGEDYVWTASGDSIFLRDEKGKLILWWSY